MPVRSGHNYLSLQLGSKAVTFTIDGCGTREWDYRFADLRDGGWVDVTFTYTAGLLSLATAATSPSLSTTRFNTLAHSQHVFLRLHVRFALELCSGCLRKQQWSVWARDDVCVQLRS